MENRTDAHNDPQRTQNALQGPRGYLPEQPKRYTVKQKCFTGPKEEPHRTPKRPTVEPKDFTGGQGGPGPKTTNSETKTHHRGTGKTGQSTENGSQNVPQWTRENRAGAPNEPQ